MGSLGLQNPRDPPSIVDAGGGRLTSAVGKRGTANCSRPVTWICMVVSERWKVVSAWARRDHSPAVRCSFPGAPSAAEGLFPCSPSLRLQLQSHA